MTRKLKIGLTIGIILSSIFLFFLFLPTFLSTSLGTQQLVKIINNKIPGTVAIQKMELRWGGPQKITHLSLKESEGKEALHVDTLCTDASLFEILRNYYGYIEVRGLEAFLYEKKAGLTNIHEALGFQGKTQCGCTIKNPITLHECRADIHYRTSHDPILFKVKGKTDQKGVQGIFAADINFEGLSKEKFDQLRSEGANALLSLNSQADIRLKAHISEFPVDLLEYALAWSNPEWHGICRAILGKTLNLEMDNAATSQGVRFAMQAKSQTLKAEIAGQITPEKISFIKPGKISVEILPEFFTCINCETDGNLPISLARPTRAELEIDQLVMPFSFFQNTKLPKEEPILLAQVRLDQAHFRTPFLGTISLEQLHAACQAPQSVSTAVLQFHGKANYHGQPIQLQLGATIDKPRTITDLIDAIKRKAKLELRAKEVPTAFLENYLPQFPLQTMIGQNFSVQLESKIEEKSILAKANFTSEQLKSATATISLKADEDDLYQAEIVSDLSFSQQHLLTTIFGGPIHLHLTSSAEESLISSPLKMVLNSPLAAIEADGQFTSDNELILLSPILANYQLTPALTKQFDFIKNPHITLAETSLIELKIDPFKINLNALNALPYLSGEIKAKDVVFQRNKEEMNLQYVHIPWHFNEKQGQINIELKANTHLAQGAAGSLKGHFVISNFYPQQSIQLANLNFSSDLAFGHVPTGLLEMVMPNQDLENLFGKSVDIILSSNLAMAGPSGNVDLIIHGDQLKCEAALKIDEIIALQDSNRPMILEANLTPERFKALRKALDSSEADTLMLIKPSRIKATISALNIPRTLSNLGLFPYSLVASLSLDQFELQDLKTNKKLLLDDLQVNVESKDITKKIAFQVHGKERGPDGHHYLLKVNGIAENLILPDGSLNSQELALNLDVKAPNLPAGLFCRVGCIPEDIRSKVEALLGEAIDTDVKASFHRMNGEIVASLKGKNGRFLLDGKLRNGALTLNKPFELEVAVTPQLGQSILKDIIPILSGIIRADNPITITIDPQGFILPITEFDFANSAIGLATIHLGKMTFSNGGQLGTVLELLRPSSTEELAVWFTPLYIDMHEGIIRLGRMDMFLLNHYHAALWGKIDAIKDKVDMRIGLTGPSLTQALNLSKPLENDYMLQFPLKGTMGNASIDKGKAAARISSLVAQSQGGAQGLIIGTFLGIAGGSLSDDKPPAPTTSPFPWEKKES